MLLLSRLFPYIGALLAILSLVIMVYRQGVISERERALNRAIKGVEAHGKIERGVMSLTDSALDKRLQRWYRD